MNEFVDRWQARLPTELLEHVVQPVRIETHCDDEVPASKWLGYDHSGSLCYYRHRFAQRDVGVDHENDEPFIVLLRAEELEAWRTCLGSWIRRIQRIDGDGRADGRARDCGFEHVDADAIPRR